MLKQLILGLTLSASVLVAAPVQHADASWWGSRLWNRILEWREQYMDKYQDSHAVPELDPSGAGTAMVLLIGGAAYIVSRRREDEEQA